jgi:selenocysteine lyase/cysteine desulfurase
MGTGALILGKPFVERDGNDRHEGEETKQPPWAAFELGTKNIGLIAGFAKACAIKQQEGLKTATLESVRKEVRQTLSKTSGVKFLEWEGPHSPGIFSFTCLDKQTEARLQSKPHNIVWKYSHFPKI